MTFTTRVKCVVLLVSLIFNGYEFAEEKHLTNGGSWVQGIENANKQNREILDQPLDLTSIFGDNWKNENKPLEKEELEVILKDIFRSKSGKEIESSTQRNFKPNDITFGTIARKKLFSESSIDQNTKAPWQDSQETPKLENTDDITFSTQTAFPFEIFNGRYVPDGHGGVILASSSYRPDTTSLSSPYSTASSFRPKSQSDVYASTTPRYWYGSQGIFNSTVSLVSVDSDVNPRADASTTSKTHVVVTSTTPTFTPETHTKAKPDITSYSPSPVNPTVPNCNPDTQCNTNPVRPNYRDVSLVSVESDVNPRADASTTTRTHVVVTSTTPSFTPETHTKAKPDITSYSPSPVNPTGPNCNPDTQCNTNPVRPNYRAWDAIRPSYGHGFGSSGVHRYRTQYWPSSYRYDYRPQGYWYSHHHGHIHNPNGRYSKRHHYNFHQNLNSNQGSDVQYDYGKNIDVRFGSGANTYQYQSERAPPMVYHHNHHRHYHHPEIQYY